MMRVQALSIGSTVPRGNFEVAVHSAFQHAVNLKLAGENRLLTLLASSQPDLPQGIRLDSPSDLPSEALPIGIRGTCEDGVLDFDKTLEVDLREAYRWNCDLTSLNVDMTSQAVLTAWRCVWGALNERQLKYGSEIMANGLLYQVEKESVLVKQIRKSLFKILEMTRKRDLTDLDELKALIGLGTGLTPSGDDLLTGYLAGLWCTTGKKPERLKFLSALGKVVIELSRRTNDISRTYLYHAACGGVSSRLVDLTNAICTGADKEQVLLSTEATMQTGHASGMDAVTGLLFGLAAWDGFDLIVFQ